MLEKSVSSRDHPRIYAGDEVMRRDDDLIRKLMLDFEANDEPLLVHTDDGDEDDGEGSERVYFHLKLLADSGFLEEGRNSVFRMTNAGHDFCAAIRDDTIWKKTKEASASVAGVSLSVMKDIGIGYLRAKLSEMGVPLG